MLSYFQAIMLGGLQGVTELFPISSLGHSIVFPALFGWRSVNQDNNLFLIFLVATHLATALVLFGFYFRDWMHIIAGLGRSLRDRYIDPSDTYARLGWLLIVSSIPAGILGLIFEEKLKLLFSTPLYVGCFLVANGILLYGAELLRTKQSGVVVHDDTQIARLSWRQSMYVGLAQCLALIPGFSRTGSTIAGGLLIGLDHKSAARFSFLLATPIIFAAAVLKLPELLTNNVSYSIGPVIAGCIASALAAYGAVRFLSKYFETQKMTPFAIYCVIFGGLVIALLH